MDSLNTTLTPFDDFGINCLVHETPAIGVCGENLCKERRFFCMKCVESGETCISCMRHELVTLSELLFRFFIKQETKAIDLVEINSMMETLKEIDRMEVSKNLSDFTKNCQSNVNKCVDNFFLAMKQNFDNAKKTNLMNMERIMNVVSGIKAEKENMDKLQSIKVPECLLDFNYQNVKDYLKSESVSREEKENCIQTIKYLTNIEKVSKTVSAMDDVIQLDKLTTKQVETVNDLQNLSENPYESLEINIDAKIKEIESKIFAKIEDLEKMIIPSKEVVVVVKSTHQKFTSDPNSLIFKQDICETAHKSNSIDSVFCAFKSVKGDNFVCWGTPTFTVEIYDLKLEKIIKTITSAHTSTIFSCRHYLEKTAKRDLLITSSYDKSVKVWSVKDNWTNLINIQSAHTGYYIYSVCILFDEADNKNYIISAAPNEFTKVWDFNGKHVKDFGVNTESTYFINCWYDSKKKKHYIINANSTDVKTYDFKTGLLYKSYKGTPPTWHMSAMVNEQANMYQLIESDGSGNIRIWDFDNATLLKMISTSGINLRGLSLWNDNYIFAAGSDYHVKLYDLKTGTFVKNLTGHVSTVCALDKIVHPKYGECLISHALDGRLKLWIAK